MQEVQGHTYVRDARDAKGRRAQGCTTQWHKGCERYKRYMDARGEKTEGHMGARGLIDARGERAGMRGTRDARA